MTNPHRMVFLLLSGTCWLLAGTEIRSFAQHDGDGGALRRTVTVNGQATVYVQPDEVQLRFDVHTFDKHLPTAKSANDAAAKGVLDFLREQGVEDKWIQTDRMRSEAVYDRENEDGRWRQGPLRGYTVMRSYAVTLKDLGRFQAIADRLLTDASITVQGHAFRSSQMRAHRDAARLDALKAAKEKAAAMAGAYGCRLGPPTSINESDDRWGFGGGGASAWDNSFRPAGDGPEDTADVPVQLGQIAVRSTVSVTFELVPEK
mgnify:CR=1 FL=1